jgi:exosortase B
VAATQARSGLPWYVLLAGLAAMYLPVYWAASRQVWRSDELAHGPIILVLSAWLFWRSRERIVAAASTPAPAVGWPLFAAGMLLYGLGRTFSVASMEFFSQPLVLAGSLALIGGRDVLRSAWFPLVYLLFMVPLPASLVDALTGPLKNWISALVVELLYLLGYPIAREGVMISIGPYLLLVADACSGLNSMFSLTAVGALFIHLKPTVSRLHAGIMVAAILPIAFIANIVRVITLVLVTYHVSDEAGQGFLHSAAGLVLMLAALAFMFALDALLTVATNRRRTAGGRDA